MKTRIREFIVVLALLLVFTAARGAVSFAISPSAISNTYGGTITLQVTGLSAGDTVTVQKYLDANTNSVVDGGDLLWQQFQLSDGTNSVFHDGGTLVTNFNVPGDNDTVSGQITALLYPSQDFSQEICGKYLYVLSSPAGHFSPITNSFAVTNFPFAQSFSGNVVSNALTISNAVVLLFQPGPDNSLNPQVGTVANNAGAYFIKAPTGTYLLAAFKSNFVANLNASPYVSLGAGATITTNVPLTNATQIISGRIQGTNNTTIGLPGLLVAAQTTNGFLSVGVTDTNGNFNIGVRANVWKVGPSDQSLNTLGYVKTGNSLKVNTSGGSQLGLVIGMPKATAIFYGSVRDNLGNPLPGIDVFGDDNTSNGGFYQYDGDGFTSTNGNYVLGTLGGDAWEVDINGVDQHGIYTNYLFTEAPSQQDGGTNFSSSQAIHQNFTGILATNYITGSVHDGMGNPVVGLGVNCNATIGGQPYQNHTETDANGNYSLNVANGSWDVSVNCGDGGDGLQDIYTNGNAQCPGDQFPTINNNNGTANFIVQLSGIGQVFGYVLDAYGNPVSGVNVYANDGFGDYYSGATDGSGHYSLFVVDSSYDVSVDCGQLNAQNYNCATDNFVSVSDNSVEADFNVAFITTPVYPFTTLYGFSAGNANALGLFTNSDGASPYGGLLLVSNLLYGTAEYGGTNGAGTIFAVSTNLSSAAFVLVHAFAAPNLNSLGTYTNSEGGVPADTLIASSNILYGTAQYGGLNGNGTVFALNAGGSNYRVIHTFTALDAANQTTNTDGADPYAGLVLSSNILYGTAVYGGTNGNGTVFGVGTNGSLAGAYPFTGLGAGAPTNVDGVGPYGTLILSGATLYGTAAFGGTNLSGTVFKVNTNGTGFTVLYEFTGGNDGAAPVAGLVLVSNILYGTASAGGYFGNGTIFTINTNGTGFAVLHAFSGFDDGADPEAGLICSGNTLYGTAQSGGGGGNGTVFAISTAGTNFIVLHGFTGGDDGANPYDNLLLVGNTLYGTTSSGGNNGNGTVFAVSVTALASRPFISSPVFLGNGQFLMSVNGQANQNYTVQVVTNLVSTNWVPLWVTNPPSSVFLFSDPHATNQQRFYRIWVGP